MARRLLPFTLALVIGATPIASELCMVFCAESPAASAPSEHAHHGSGHSMAGHEMPADEMDGDQSQTTHHANMAIEPRSDDQPVVCGTPSFSIGSSSACLHGGEEQAVSAPAEKLALDAPVALPHVAEAVGPPGVTTWLVRATSVTIPPIPLELRTPLRV
jgi:hypothetical protein